MDFMCGSMNQAIWQCNHLLPQRPPLITPSFQSLTDDIRRVVEFQENPELVTRFATPDIQRIVERVFFIDVVSFDWNCPKYITPRYTAAEVEEAVAPLRQRIAELEAELKTKN
jgi:hypothetical protein